MSKVIRVVGCILRNEDKILMLHRSKSETDPSLWGIPAGKVEADEGDLVAVTREVFEETGVVLEANNLKHLGELTIKYDSFTVIFPIFHADFDERPNIILDELEHVEYKWLTVGQALETPNLMKDVDKILVEFCVEKLGMIQD